MLTNYFNNKRKNWKALMHTLLSQSMVGSLNSFLMTTNLSYKTTKNCKMKIRFLRRRFTQLEKLSNKKKEKSYKNYLSNRNMLWSRSSKSLRSAWKFKGALLSAMMNLSKSSRRWAVWCGFQYCRQSFGKLCASVKEKKFKTLSKSRPLNRWQNGTSKIKNLNINFWRKD